MSGPIQIENYVLGNGYWLTLARQLGTSTFEIVVPSTAADPARRVARGTVDGCGVILRFDSPEIDQHAVTPLCPRVLAIWTDLQRVLREGTQQWQ